MNRPYLPIVVRSIPSFQSTINLPYQRTVNSEIFTQKLQSFQSPINRPTVGEAESFPSMQRASTSPLEDRHPLKRELRSLRRFQCRMLHVRRLRAKFSTMTTTQKGEAIAVSVAELQNWQGYLRSIPREKCQEMFSSGLWAQFVALKNELRGIVADLRAPIEQDIIGQKASTSPPEDPNPPGARIPSGAGQRHYPQTCHPFTCKPSKEQPNRAGKAPTPRPPCRHSSSTQDHPSKAPSPPCSPKEQPWRHC
jgi:hypothetical protein